MCDRQTQSRVALQRSFIDAIALPLFSSATRLMPNLAPVLRQLKENRRALDQLTDTELLAKVSPLPCYSPGSPMSAQAFVTEKTSTCGRERKFIFNQLRERASCASFPLVTVAALVSLWQVESIKALRADRAAAAAAATSPAGNSETETATAADGPSAPLDR